MLLSNKRKVSDTKSAQIRALRKEGKSVAMIAQELGLGRSTVDRHLVASADKRKLTESQVFQIRRLRRKGEKIGDIATQFGVSFEVVSAACKATYLAR